MKSVTPAGLSVNIPISEEDFKKRINKPFNRHRYIHKDKCVICRGEDNEPIYVDVSDLEVHIEGWANPVNHLS